MIKEKTVFILGAGASVPYGYPTGKELRVEIYTEHPNNLKNASFREYDSTVPPSMIEQAESLAKKFEKSSTESIDLFLARNTEFSQTGLLAIVLTVLRREQHSRFREKSYQPEQDWYTLLFTKMTESFTKRDDYKEFGNNNVSFVTFNYDRSLEFILHESLRNSFGLAKDNEIVEQLREIPIFHVYGKIADLPWEDPDGIPYLNSEPDKPINQYPIKDYEKLLENIQTMHKRSEEDRSVMVKQIADATKVFFLGFGYAQENIEILNLKSTLQKGQLIYGTAFDRFKKEILDIKESLGFKREFITERDGIPRHRNPMILPTDCVGLLREWL